MAKARLYLDVDGVLNATNPDPAWGSPRSATVTVNYGGGYQARYRIRWAPALIAALDELRDEFDVELVFLTTWCENDSARRKLVPKLDGLRHGRSLPYVEGGRDGSGRWKPEALLKDLELEGELPFIWVDDVEVAAHGDMLFDRVETVKYLLVEPQSYRGLTVAEVVRMREWLAALA